MDRIEGSAAVSMTFRVEMFRERAAARKAVVSHEAEAAEAATQIASLDEVTQEIRERLEEVERKFAGGRVFAPISGVVSTNLAHRGQSLVAGTPIAEVLDQSDVFVDWYVPNERLRDPKVGNDVLVLFGDRRISGQTVEILPVSDVYAGRPSIARERTATQIARVRFNQGTVPPPLSSTVYVHMHYTDLASRAADGLITLFGLY